MTVGILFLLILIPLIFGIPILIAVYVYRDANKRGMNAILWMLIALLAPSFLGLIIYLLVRNNYSDLTCPNCNAPVEESFLVCPNCRTKLRPTCDTCSAPVQTTWKVCPHCGSELPEYSYDVATPVRQKDKSIGKILIAILVIPVVLILLIFIAFFMFSVSKRTGWSSSGVVTLTMDEFMESQPEYQWEHYDYWFDQHSAPVNGQPYHIWEGKSDTSGTLYEYQYLIYIPGASGYQDVSYDTKTKGFFNRKEYLTVDITCDENGEEQLLFIFTYEGNVKPPENFLISYNGEEHEIIPYSSTNALFYDPYNKPIAK